MLGQGRFLFPDTRTFSKLPTQICSGTSYRSKELASGLSWPREKGVDWAGPWGTRGRGRLFSQAGRGPGEVLSAAHRANNGLL